MTVASATRIVTATGNDLTTVWPFSFKIPAGTAEVTLTTVATGVEGAALDSSLYSIAGEDDENGGTVTYPLSGLPLSSAFKINIKRVVPIEQTLDLTDQSAYFPTSLETQLDLIVMMLTQVSEELARAVKVDPGSDTDPNDLLATVLTAAEDVLANIIGDWDSVNANGADIASAATLNLDAATGNVVDVTGATGISAVTLTAGRWRMVRFTGAPLITVSATLVGNNGGSDVQAAAGDYALFRGYSGGVVRFIRFPITGASVPAATDILSGIVELSTDAEAITGTDTERAITPANLAAVLADKAYARLGVEDQTLTGGVRVTSKSLGTPTAASTVTLDPGDRPLQHLTNNAAFTLAPGANTGSILLDITNGASAGAITTSGWTKVVGAFTTTNADKFRCSCSIGNGGSLLSIQALQ